MTIAAEGVRYLIVYALDNPSNIALMQARSASVAGGLSATTAPGHRRFYRWEHFAVERNERGVVQCPGMRAALVFTRNASEQKFELSGSALTIGRGTECELQVADERISTRHCRLSVHGGEWMIEDLKSTNRTFVNGEPVGDRPRRLVHGDLVRLGAHDARLFEAQFVTGERPRAPGVAPQAPGDGFRKRIAELEAQLAARDAEAVRIGGMYKHLQSQLGQHEAAMVAARRASATMTSEIEGLQDELASARADHAGCRDELERAHRRCAELETQREEQARKARRQLDDGDRSRKELESKLSMAASELAVTKAALASATDNVRTLKEAYDDVLVRLTNGGT